MKTTIHSVRYVADEGVTIVATQKNEETGAEQEITLRSHDAPTPDFAALFVKLQKGARELLELPGEWGGDGFEVRKATWSEGKGGAAQASITGITTLVCANAPFNWTTPNVLFETEDGSNAFAMPKPIRRLLDQLRVAAEAYLAGERAQGDLFGAGAGADAEAPQPEAVN